MTKTETAALKEVFRLACALVATADLSEPKRHTTTVSSDHLDELMEALEAVNNAE